MDGTTRVPLGSSGVSVTRLGLGTAALGGLYAAVEEDVAAAVLDRAAALGVGYLDTAPRYGSGTAERRLGSWLRAAPPEVPVLSTKVGRVLVAEPGARTGHFAHGAGYRQQFDFSADGVRRSLEESLDRLGVNRIDVVYLHDPDDHADQALREAYPVLHELRSQGVIGAVGVGMNQTAVPARFVRETDLDVVLLAGRYTLLDRSGEDELLPLCLDRGVAVVVGGVYNSGVLADPTPGARFDYEPAPPAVLATARRMQEVAAAHGVPLKAAAIQFPFRHPAVSCVLTGGRDVAELDENVAMFGHPIPAQAWADLDAVRAGTR
jgi:D-threo-aldose 1-dehydrogenase